jgi:DNA (cytosine-5)-methyltransferase 1
VNGSYGNPRLLDLFCCEGGAGEGYHRAGFDVLGVDLERQPRYPHEFIQSDALGVLDAMADGMPWWQGFDAIHASPPCQAHSDLQKQSKREYPDFIAPVRERLQAIGLPYVIENVEGAPLEDPVLLCGTMFPSLRVIRHRLFETNWPLRVPRHIAPSDHPLVFTHDKRKGHYGRLDQDTSYVQVTGGGNCTVANKRAAMGTPWMTGKGCNEAIPPVYTAWIGMQLRRHLELEHGKQAA